MIFCFWCTKNYRHISSVKTQLKSERFHDAEQRENGASSQRWHAILRLRFTASRIVMATSRFLYMNLRLCFTVTNTHRCCDVSAVLESCLSSQSHAGGLYDLSVAARRSLLTSPWAFWPAAFDGGQRTAPFCALCFVTSLPSKPLVTSPILLVGLLQHARTAPTMPHM